MNSELEGVRCFGHINAIKTIPITPRNFHESLVSFTLVSFTFDSLSGAVKESWLHTRLDNFAMGYFSNTIPSLVFCNRASDDANQQRLVGATKCTWGPSYWCSGLRQSAKCGATKHCIRTIWESNPYPEVRTDQIKNLKFKMTLLNICLF